MVQGKSSSTSSQPATASISHIGSRHQLEPGRHRRPPLPPQVLPRTLPRLLARLRLSRLPRLPLPKRLCPLCQEFQELQHRRGYQPQFWGPLCRSLHCRPQDWTGGICPSEHLCEHSCPENEWTGEEGERSNR